MTIITNSTFWIALGSIATFLMALFTYKLLRYYNKSDEQRIYTETVEKIIQPLTKNLENVSRNLKGLYLSHSNLYVNIKDIWEWPIIQQEYSVLVYRLSESIRKRINRFHEMLEKLVHLSNQRLYLLDTIIIKEIESKVLEAVKNETRKDSLNSGAKGTGWQLSVGGKRYRITLHELIFQDQTLDEYINELKNDHEIPNKDIEEEKFIVDGANINSLDKNVFREMASGVLRKIKDSSRLQDFVEKCRQTHKEALNLKQALINELVK